MLAGGEGQVGYKRADKERKAHYRGSKLIDLVDLPSRARVDVLQMEAEEDIGGKSPALI